MTQQELKARLNVEPFEPFRVNTADGKHFDITDPEMVIASKTRLFIVFEREGWTDIVLRHITSVEGIRAA